jgi:hypothetical protein
LGTSELVLSYRQHSPEKAVAIPSALIQYVTSHVPAEGSVNVVTITGDRLVMGIEPVN